MEYWAVRTTCMILNFIQCDITYDIVFDMVWYPVTY